MLPDNPAYVFSIRSGLATKARGVSGEGDRQPRIIEDLVTIQIGDRDLRRWHEPKVLISMRHAEEVGGKLWQLSGSVHGFRVHHVWRQDFGVSVFFGVNVEHEVGE